MTTPTTDGSVANLTETLKDNPVLDMCFVMDATGSMSSFIEAAQKTIQKIVENIVSSEKADVRFALVSYRDHPPQESSYVVKQFAFTKSTKKMSEFLAEISASGGGDCPEAVVDGLHAALKLDWRENSTKVCLLISDAPPHGLGTGGDGFPEGCPCGLDPVLVCRQMAEKAITLYVIGCEPSITPYKTFFMSLAHITGGQYCPLGNAKILSEVVVGGCREEIALERLMVGVTAELQTSAIGMSEEDQAQHIFKTMQDRKVKTSKLTSDRGEMPVITEDALEWSKSPSLAVMREKMSKLPPVASAGFARSGAAAPSATAPAPSKYFVSEEAVSMAQCYRMVSKSNARG